MKILNAIQATPDSVLVSKATAFFPEAETTSEACDLYARRIWKSMQFYYKKNPLKYRALKRNYDRLQELRKKPPRPLVSIAECLDKFVNEN